MNFFIGFAAVPFVMIVVFYTAIVIIFHREGKISLHLSQKVQHQRIKKNERISFMMIAVVVVFFSSWTPYFVYFFLHYYPVGSDVSCITIRWIWLKGDDLSSHSVQSFHTLQI